MLDVSGVIQCGPKTNFMAPNRNNNSREQPENRIFASAAHHLEYPSLHVKSHCYNALVKQCGHSSGGDAHYGVSEKSFRGLTPLQFVEYEDASVMWQNPEGICCQGGCVTKNYANIFTSIINVNQENKSTASDDVSDDIKATIFLNQLKDSIQKFVHQEIKKAFENVNGKCKIYEYGAISNTKNQTAFSIDHGGCKKSWNLVSVTKDGSPSEKKFHMTDISL